jgi:hypothetical protein
MSQQFASIRYAAAPILSRIFLQHKARFAYCRNAVAKISIVTRI